MLLLLLLSRSVVPNPARPQRRPPTRLPRPWDSPGKNTGVGCHIILQCMKGKSEREVAQSCLTLSNLVDCSPPGSSIHGIFQARALEWGASPMYRSRRKWWLPGARQRGARGGEPLSVGKSSEYTGCAVSGGLPAAFCPQLTVRRQSKSVRHPIMPDFLRPHGL